MSTLDELIHHEEDHVLVMDLGPAESVEPRVSSLGKAFSPVTREARFCRAPPAPVFRGDQPRPQTGPVNEIG